MSAATIARTPEVETAVIGGGLVGAAIALGMARCGREITVFDGEDLDLRASRANFALVWVQGKGLGNPHYALWSKASAELWPQFAAGLQADTGIDLALSQRGAFSFALKQEELDAWRGEMETIAEETSGAAAPYRVLDHAETRDMVPAIGRDVVGAIYSPLDGHVNSLRLLRALHCALRSRNVSYRSRHAVDFIEPLASGFLLSGAWGRVMASQVVLAAGVDNGRLAEMVGLSVPLRASKGHIVVTEKCRPFFPYTSGTVRQADEGGVMIGDSEELSTVSTAVRSDIAAVLAERAVRTFPLLADVNVVRCWAGIRVKTIDGLPVYEQSATHPGAFSATCHSGVTLAANHALTVAPQIAAGALSAAMSAFASARFHVPKN